MPAQFCYLDGPVHPFRLCNGGTSSASLEIPNTIMLRWDDGTTVETVTPTGAPGGIVVTDISGAGTFDGLHYVWLALTYKGAGGQIYVTEETRFLDIDSDLQALGTATYNWTVLARIHGIVVDTFQQAGAGLPAGVVVVTGTPADGDIPVFSSGVWQLLPPGSAYEVIASTGTDPGYITVENLLKGTVLPNGGDMVYNNAGTVSTLSIGSANEILMSGGGTIPAWVNIQVPLGATLLTTKGDIAWNDGTAVRRLAAPTTSAGGGNTWLMTGDGSGGIAWVAKPI